MRKRTLLISLLAFNLWLSTLAAAAEAIEIIYFFSPGCRECDEVKDLLAASEKELGLSLKVRSRDLTRDDNLELLWAWEDRTGKKADGLVALVIGGEFLAGLPEIKERLEEALLKSLEGSDSSAPSENRTVESEFQKFGPWAVLGAGLIDGINPCAFVVMVLLISFLTVAGQNRENTFRIGLGFALAVFLTYFFLGLGLFSVVVRMLPYRRLADGIYLAVGGISFLLGVVSLYDAAVIYRSREIKDARLKLPPVILGKIQNVMSRSFNPRHIFFSALVLGFLVSLLELVCTGQIYFPTIIVIMQNQALRKKAFAYLILYCSAFILPLLCVFGAVYWGSGSPHLAELTGRYSWVAKVLTGLIFLALSFFLFTHF